MMRATKVIANAGAAARGRARRARGVVPAFAGVRVRFRVRQVVGVWRGSLAGLGNAVASTRGARVAAASRSKYRVVIVASPSSC